jgi:hypothetical protein
MKRGAQVAFDLSALFFCFFVFGITEVGQVVLRGRIPPGAGNFQLDDMYMAAALAPWTYGLGPCLLLALTGSALLVWHRLKHRTWRKIAISPTIVAEGFLETLGAHCD